MNNMVLGVFPLFWVDIICVFSVYFDFSVVGGPTLAPRQPTVTEVAKLETELNFVKRELNVSVSLS